MRRLLLLLLVLTALGLCVWAFLPRPVDVEAGEIALRTIEVAIEEEGEARIREVFTVSANAGGKLHRISLHAGDDVRANETVVALIGPAAPALLDARQRAVAEAAAAAAEASIQLAHALLAQAEASLEFKTSEADRSRLLYQKSAISRRQLDSVILEQKTALAALDSARANLAVRERELESARAMLSSDETGGVDRCCVELVAPVSGKVLRVLTEDEQVVLPATPILEIGDPANMEIVVDILSRDAVRVHEGRDALITGWGGPPIPAKVERVEPSAVTRVSALGIDEQRVEVILALAGDDTARKLLGHGFRVIARIVTWRGEEVLSIPVGALFRDGSDWATFVIRDGRARLQILQIGERNEAFAQVLSGLENGDRVILHPDDRIADGIPVRPAGGAD
jgi:HlyD family secretion protein